MSGETPSQLGKKAGGEAFGFGAYQLYARTFEYAPEILFAVSYGSVIPGDFDNDGRLDIVAMASSLNFMDLYLQEDDGSFGDPVIYHYGDDRRSPGGEIVVNDFNNDGIDDVAFEMLTGESDYGSIGLLLSRVGGLPYLHNGSRDFGESSADSPRFATLDVDGDGNQDMVLGRRFFGPYPSGTTCTEPSVCPYYEVFYGDGRGNFGRSEWIRVDSSGSIAHVGADDLNNDGILDLLLTAVQPPNGRMLVAYGLEHGGLSEVRELFTFTESKFFYLGDLDGNGRKDFIRGHEVHLQTSEGIFEGPVFVPRANSYPDTPVMADFDGDGYVDMASHQFGAFFSIPYLSIYLQRNGAPVETLRIQDPPSRFLFKVSNYKHPYATGDFNSDGCTDIAIAVEDDGLAVLPGQNCIRRSMVTGGKLPARRR